jgi:CII-binding regulator of phage lambda lysogenization HflD
MGVYDSRARAVKGLKELMGQWAETGRSWNDEVSRAFFKKYLEHLESDMRSASSAMDHMAQMIQQCKRDCE